MAIFFIVTVEKSIMKAGEILKIWYHHRLISASALRQLDCTVYLFALQKIKPVENKIGSLGGNCN